MIGELIDHYRVLELVGCGAMGVVYKGLDVNLDRPVAIKVMGAEARNGPDFVERFRQEARMQAALNHPNVALLFDYFVHDGAPVAVMEFIDGESLEQLIRRRGAIPAHEAVPLFKQALRGVAAAHRAGIIHRDLKSSNLMITKDGVVKVMDFGIAKRQGVTGGTKASSTSIGSPLYMAPEQILGNPVDCRTDVYALGVTLYQLLSGQPPFDPRGKTEYSVLNAHVNDLPEPPTVHCRDIPGPVVDAVLRAIAKEPEARFQSVDEFLLALPDMPAGNGAAAPQLRPTGTMATPRMGPTGTVAIPRMGPTGTVAIPRVGPTAAVAIPRVGPTGTVAIPRVGPTGTVAIPRVGPTAAVATALVDPSDTVALEYLPSMSEDPATAFESAPPARDPRHTMAFDYFAATLQRESFPRPSAPSVAARPSDNSAPASPAPSPAARGLRGARPALVAVLVAMVVLGTMIRHGERLHVKRPDASLDSWTAAQTPVSTEPAAPPPVVPNPAAEAPAAPRAEMAAATTVPATVTPLTTTTAPARPDLSGTWRGEYVDASGRQLLRVVNLSISRVDDDGGIEGTLQYQAASGQGECKLHPRGSSYSAGEQRLQLSPEGCTAHYPKELGVPLDFSGVNPQANILKDGRIEAPTGEVIVVKLKRVSGV
ncbi:MAG: serine/threonine-protein kinase [Steroidobacteraceae bacterium]